MGRSTKFAFFALLLSGTAQAQMLDALPPRPDLPLFQWFASTDPKKQNADYLLLKPNETRRIPLAAGTLERLWSTSLAPNQTDLTLIAGPHRQQVLLSGGKAARGLIENKAFTFFPTLKGDSLANLETGAALLATNRAKESNKWFYQVAIRPPVAAITQTKATDVARRLFKVELAPGEEKAIESFEQPGEITEFSVAPISGKIDFYQLRLIASFDGQGAVDASLFGLAGQSAGSEIIHNAVADYDGSRLVLRWPMPFQTAKIALRNEGRDALSLDVGARVSGYAQAPSPYRFCALQSSRATQKGQPVKVLDLKGEGAFVGLSLATAPGEGTARRTFAYLEGNETLVADGKTFEGTGTEDFFSSAWYYPDKPFFHPYEGMTQKIAMPPSVSAYRLMIPDAVPFKKSFLFNFEHGNGNNTDGMKWSWTSFWYQKPPLALPQSEMAPLTPTSDAPATASNESWKLTGALGAGVLLGIISAVMRRRRRAAS